MCPLLMDRKGLKLVGIFNVLVQVTLYSIRQQIFFILKHYKQGYMFRLKVSHFQAYTILWEKHLVTKNIV